MTRKTRKNKARDDGLYHGDTIVVKEGGSGATAKVTLAETGVISTLTGKIIAEVRVERRAISLVRIEAAYGPIYLVVDTFSDFKPDTPEQKVLDFAKLAIESFGEPHITFRNVLAVIKGGRCCPPDVFTHIKSVEVPLDYDFEKEIHRTKAGIFQMFPEAAHS